jgi:hypothetical protein
MRRSRGPKIRLPATSYEERCRLRYGYESNEDFKLRLRRMLPHNEGMSILGAPRPHPSLVRPNKQRENVNENETAQA